MVDRMSQTKAGNQEGSTERMCVPARWWRHPSLLDSQLLRPWWVSPDGSIPRHLLGSQEISVGRLGNQMVYTCVEEWKSMQRGTGLKSTTVIY